MNGIPKIIISADTIVSFEGRIIEKPFDREDARRMLREFEGKKVTVLTGVAILYAEHSFSFDFHANSCSNYQHVPPDYIMDSFVEESVIEFGHYDDFLLEAYLKSNEWCDKSGAIGYQEIGLLFFKGLEGCYANVVGFPLYTIFRKLREVIGKNMKNQENK